MSELEKFKRRLIRMVSRLQIEEKKPEDELWEYLRKQTKSDCQLVWKRMRILTLKRLKRLLMADDRRENIASIARMSLTDWLLFDSILVHEDIDVIGKDLAVPGVNWDRRPMYELFSLVQQFDLEGLRDEPLARAWTAATVHYNRRGRQCSPMLLQRRWYQLKEVTRQKFYSFWFMYRGNFKLLVEALKEQPTRLQSAIAKRYPHIITTPFLSWEEAIQQRLVIMPAEFDHQMKRQTDHIPPLVKDNDPDIVLLEPEIETIDLRVDSDSDNDLRNEVESEKAQQIIADENASAVKSITLKQEPMDSDIIDSIDLDEHNFDIDQESIDALESMDNPSECNANDDSIDNTDVMETNEESRASTESGVREDIESTESAAVDVASSSIRLESQSGSKDEVLDESPANTGECSKHIEDRNELHTENAIHDVEEVLPSEDLTQEMEQTDISEVVTADSEVNTEMSTMPIIANVMESVNMSDDTFDVSNDAPPEKQSEEEYFDEESEMDIIKTEVIDVSDEGVNFVSTETEVGQTNKANVDIDECEVTNTEEKTVENSISEFIPDVTFEDDGIEFMDDGIIEENYSQQTNAENTIVKEEITNEDNEKEAESQSIDLKLIMFPVVYTKKLEDMEVLKDQLVSHVNDKEKIELILNESKPVSKVSIQIKEEQPDNNISTDDDEVAHDDLFENRNENNDFDNGRDSDSDGTDDDGIPEENKVKKSSILFQKPRNRDYGPLSICKNPDFNTRLKRLTVGFLSYTRNRFLLRACKPLTIDLCKAFESKLVNNTIYFKEDSTSQVVVKKETVDLNDKVEEPQVVPQDNLVETIAPASIPVQGVMDTLVKQQILSPPSKECAKIREIKDNDVVAERNKVIVLPSIDNVRRINRNLLTAEVPPMRVDNKKYTDEPEIVTEKIKPVSEKSTENTVICRGEVIAGVTNNFVGNNMGKVKPRPLPWRSTDRVKVGFWNSATSVKHKPKIIKLDNDQLLTVDTLNKMLNIIHWKDPHNQINDERTKRRNEVKLGIELQKRVDEFNRKTTGEKIEEPPKEAPKPKRKKAKVELFDAFGERRYGTYCCWIKFKQVHRRSANPHPCSSEECLCCCRPRATDADPSIAKVCQSIESVVEQSRDIVQNESLETVQSSHNDVNNDVNKINHDSTIENNILEADAIPDYSNETVVGTSEAQSTDDCVLIDSDETETREESDNPGIPQLIIKRRRGRPSKTFNSKQFVVVTNNCSESAVNEHNKTDQIDLDTVTDTSTETIPIKTYSNQGTNTNKIDDDIVNDADSFQITKTLKINIQSAENTGEPRRRRGRPSKQNPLILVNPGNNTAIEDHRIPLKILPNSTPHNLQTDYTNNVRVTRSRYNLLPVSKNVDKTSEKVVMFSKKPSNNPIFLGQNKILLTDVPLPRSKNKPLQVAAPPNTAGNTVLPQGVNMVLLPNGVLTCTVDPTVQLTHEELNTLGALIEGVQKQISSVTSTGVPNPPAGPTLQLIPGAVPTVVQSTSEVIDLDDGEKDGDENPNHDAIQPNIEVTSIVKDNNIVAPSVLSTEENTVAVSDSVDTALKASTIENSTDQSSSEPKLGTEPKDINETTQNIDIGIKNQAIEPVVMKESIPEEDSVIEKTKELEIEQTKEPETLEPVAEESSGNQETKESENDQTTEPETPNKISTTDDSPKQGQTVEPETSNEKTDVLSEPSKGGEPATSNKKTILSDLMEMSGIFDEDIAPVTETAPDIVAPAFNSVPELIMNNPPQIVEANQPPPTDVDGLRELTPVTSFSELKYACMNNGNFFKLDLQTNELNPINVCIKRKIPSRPPTQFVDLTEDIEDAANEKQEEETNEESLPTFIVRKIVKPGLPATGQSLLKEGATAKPIKLFKVVHPFPGSNILKKRKVDDFEKEVDTTEIVTETERTSKAEKRPRKQNFDSQTYEMQYVNFIGEEGEQENYEFEGSFEETAAAADDSDSSDDEPLAKKVKRRDEMLKGIQEKPVENVETAKITEGNEPEMNEPPTDVPKSNTNDSDMPETEEMDVVESEALHTELEFLSDHSDEEGEDCILGF